MQEILHSIKVIAKNKQIFLDEQSKRNKLVEEDKEKFLNHDLEQIEKYFKYVLE